MCVCLGRGYFREVGMHFPSKVCVITYFRNFDLVMNIIKVNRGNFVTRVIPSLGFCLDSCSSAVGF